MLNRTIAPSLKPLTYVNVPQAQLVEANQTAIPIYKINAGSQELVRIEFVYDAGSVYQQKKLAASVTNNLLKEGTKKYTSKQIAEAIDYYGAFLETESNRDTATVALFCLNKHLPKVLPIITSILTEPVFPENELKTYTDNSKQRFNINQQKVDHVARNLFAAKLYGSKHAYGTYVESANEYDAVTKADLQTFFAQHYLPSRIVVAGMISSDVEKQLLDVLQILAIQPINKTTQALTFDTYVAVDHYEKIPNAIQSSIRVGKRLFNKTHSDYLGMIVLNTVLGGYFGSRLMTNIREEKGYTYGIGSNIISLQQDGYFFIATEVGKDVTQDALKEITIEVNKLQQEKISDQELDLVKSYMLGTFLRSTDGAFALADKFNAITDFGLSYEFYKNYVDTVKSISSNELLGLAQKHLNDLSTVTVGDYK